MPRGASPRREREYRELKHRFKEEGRYKGREEEVASRIVNKQRREYGETREEKRKDREGRSPDRKLPIDDFQEKTIGEIERKLGDLSDNELRRIKRYEQGHKDRKTLMEKIDRQMHGK